ncbi:hypothetical protein BDW_01315 [Bdellovibrio bacteriovorus W]|nr:hypothetical protein BDW_01315 [Bdellovibrio bacteriovorus W]
MPQVTFPKKNLTIEVPQGTSLKDAAHEAGLPVASSCNAEGVCAKCKLIVIHGKENLSSPSEREAFLLQRLKIPKDNRISCLTEIRGNVTVDASYW